MTELSGKIAVVTGASIGIGRATVLRLARSGVRTVLAARDAEFLPRLKTEIETMDQTTETVTCDVTRYEACEDLARRDRPERTDPQTRLAGALALDGLTRR
jgi:NADP-dependent 3-hydroxy acid dehydrogenase YdfG